MFRLGGPVFSYGWFVALTIYIVPLCIILSIGFMSDQPVFNNAKEFVQVWLGCILVTFVGIVIPVLIMLSLGHRYDG